MVDKTFPVDFPAECVKDDQPEPELELEPGNGAGNGAGRTGHSPALAQLPASPVPSLAPARPQPRPQAVAAVAAAPASATTPGRSFTPSSVWPEPPTTKEDSDSAWQPVAREEALRRILARGPHEGGVDAMSMGERKISSIVARMDGDLRLPALSEGFDEILHVPPGDEEDCRMLVLARIWALAQG